MATAGGAALYEKAQVAWNAHTDAIDWRAWQRKRACITYNVRTGKNDAAYQMHDMVCYPPRRAFALQPNLRHRGLGGQGLLSAPRWGDRDSTQGARGGAPWQ